MTNYEAITLKAVKILSEKQTSSFEEVWKKSGKELDLEESIWKKGCPKNAFIGVCEMGLIKGIQGIPNVELSKNGKYAVTALRLIIKNPQLYTNMSGPDLWREVLKECHLETSKNYNQQMAVVLTLWNNNKIDTEKLRLFKIIKPRPLDVVRVKLGSAQFN